MDQPNAPLFRYCPKCGNEAFYSESRKSFNCRDCGFSLYLNCAAAAIGLIFTSEGHVCVTSRKNDPEKGLLDFPGGFADPGESIEACLKREINEELNLTVSSMTYLFSIPNTYKYDGVVYDITDFVFYCRVDDFNGIMARDDVEQYFFMDITVLDKKQFGLDSAKAVAAWLGTGTAATILSNLQ